MWDCLVIALLVCAKQFVVSVMNGSRIIISWLCVTCSCGPVPKRFVWLVWKNRWRVSIYLFSHSVVFLQPHQLSLARPSVTGHLLYRPPSLISRNGFLSYEEFITFFKFPDSKLIQVISYMTIRPRNRASKRSATLSVCLERSFDHSTINCRSVFSACLTRTKLGRFPSEVNTLPWYAIKWACWHEKLAQWFTNWQILWRNCGT